MWLSELFFPHRCIICGYHISDKHAFLCTYCYIDIPYAHNGDGTENRDTKLCGLQCVKHLFSVFYYDKNSEYSKLIHQLKYRNQPEIGLFLGKMIGETIQKHSFSENIDCIIPVPLHPKKEKLRGYNQCSWIAKGVHQYIEKPIVENLLYKTKHQVSQTKKSAEEREISVQNIFHLTDHSTQYHNKHILLIDDIVTTGATLRACLHALEDIPNMTITVVTAGTTL